MVFLSKTEVLELFKNFDIINFKEKEEDKPEWLIYENVKV